MSELQQLRAIKDALWQSHAVVELDMTGRVIDANDMFLTQLGYRLDEVTGKHHSIFVHPDERDSPNYRAMWDRLLAGESFHSEFKRLSKDGQEVWISAGLAPYADESGTPRGIYLFGHFINSQIETQEELRSATEALEQRYKELDETRRRLEGEAAQQVKLAKELARARDEANRANSAKSMFLATMSHEFRTPLNAILGFSEMIALKHFGPLNDRYQIYAQHILDSGTHLLSLVNDILDLSAIESGKRNVDISTLRLLTVVEGCAEGLTPLLEPRNLTMSVEIDDKNTRVLADDRALQQVLTNVLSNAIKYTDPRTHILIRAFNDKDRAKVAVIDEGPGIPPEKLEEIMEPFERGGVDDPAEDHTVGTGLGLSIAKSLMEMQNGSISLSSELGKGTTVTIDLPVDTTSASRSGA